MGYANCKLYTYESAGGSIVDVRLLYDNDAWIESAEIKSVNVIKEIDINGISAPSTIVDVTIRCERFDDLDYEIFKKCDVYIKDELLFYLYVSSSERKSDYEWSLSLMGLLGVLSQIRFYGDVYSDANDYIGQYYYGSESSKKPATFNPEYSYTPTVSTIKEIIDIVKEKDDIIIEYDDDFDDMVNTTLHKVGIKSTSLDIAVLNIMFLFNAYIDDENDKIVLKKYSNTPKQISNENILNDIKRENNTLYNVNVKSYSYECRRHGVVTYAHTTETNSMKIVDSSGGNCTVYGGSRYYTGEYWCDMERKSDGRQAPGASNRIQLNTKSSNDPEVFYEEPVSSINVWISSDGWVKTDGNPPTNPNYSPVGEYLGGEYAVKYQIDETYNIVEIEGSVGDELIEVENTLLSAEWYETIKDDVKRNFSYKYKMLLKIIERPDNFATYGVARFGSVKYGVNTGDTRFDIGDNVKFNILDKSYEGYITRMQYNLNGKILVKDCEVMCNRSDE